MISLLAGTITSPSAKLAPYRRSPSPETKSLMRARERKAIGTLINGVLSVIAAGVAAWWGSGNSGLKDEYVSS
jgi:TMEM199 family protein